MSGAFTGRYEYCIEGAANRVCLILKGLLTKIAPLGREAGLLLKTKIISSESLLYV